MLFKKDALRCQVKNYGSSPKELIQIKDSRGRGFEDSSAMLNNYKALYVFQKVKGIMRVHIFISDLNPSPLVEDPELMATITPLP
jgi:hypothetical protein